MNYIGSKLSLLEFLDAGIKSVVGDDAKNCHTFCDLFAGTGAVGTFFKKKKKFKVIANDLQYYGYVLNRHYIGNHRELKFAGLSGHTAEQVCEYLNNLPAQHGFIYNNYASGGGSERLYFSDENAGRCDAIRAQIENWKADGKINEDEYYFLLTTLLENIDKVANTASVYGAFLKKLKSSALRPLEMRPAPLFINDAEHNVYNADANQLVREIETDILYLDPPYNERQYASNYHMLETIAKYDAPEIKGKTGLRNYAAQKSDYCSRASVKRAFADLIKNAKAKYIFLSYNNEGLMTLDDVREIMSTRGEYGVFTQDYRRFKADSARNNSADKTTEYLHWLRVEN
ncbi:MAG: DNA adenine methylase [Rickettsiales bacterium]|jgi:adenine-specific DNA-methyltransferase|nr:DNA adenine methylase [Rickettsiales bacterium]